ncbi:unnamed protein product [Cunninghamella echinulata]
MDVHTVTHQCINNVCYCDWQLHIYGCVYSDGLRIIYIATAIFSALVGSLCFGIFFHRWLWKGHKLFDIHSKSILKPKPIDCLMFFLGVFNLLRLINGIILVLDVSPNNILARSFMFEFPWQFGFGSCALYLLGIAQTLADSHKSTAKEWLPSTKIVDRVGLLILLAPFILNNICTFVTGILAYTPSKIYLSEIFIRVLYIFWFLHCGILSIILVVLGARLLKILRRNMHNFKTSGDKAKAIQGGMFKIKGLVICIVVTLGGFSIFCLIYAIIRNTIIRSVAGSYIACIIWNFLAPLGALFACLAVVANPKANGNISFGLPNSSSSENTRHNNTSTNLATTQGQITSITMYGPPSQEFGSQAELKGTLSVQAYGTLKQMRDGMDYTGYPFASYEHDPKKINDHHNDFSTAIHLNSMNRS